MREALYTCPLCERGGFGARGLIAHRCSSPELLACVLPGVVLKGSPKLPRDLVDALLTDDAPWVAEIVAVIKRPGPPMTNDECPMTKGEA